MKSLTEIIYEEIINEVGEGIEPYQWMKADEHPQGVNYHFYTDDEIHYTVSFYEGFMPDFPGATFVAFDAEGYDDDETTDSNEPLKIMSTITNIVKDYAERVQPQNIVIEPSKVGSEDNRRMNLYLAYIRKNLPPEYTVQSRGDRIHISR